MDYKEAGSDNTRERSREYTFWWRLQEATLVAFLVLLVVSVAWSWWLLIPAFVLLGVNLYANFRRIAAR